LLESTVLKRDNDDDATKAKKARIVTAESETTVHPAPPQQHNISHNINSAERETGDKNTH